MASRHHKPDQRRSRLTPVLAAVLFAVAFAAIASAAVVQMTNHDATASRQVEQAPPVAVQQPLSQEGRIIAVTPDSVTAQSADGFARTYTINAETNAITVNGSTIGGAATTFTINDEVAIVGVVQDGNAIATAVADKQVTGLNGPPMDAI